MSSNGKPALFKPPPETFFMFADLEDKDGQVEDEPELLSSSASHKADFKGLAESFEHTRSFGQLGEYEGKERTDGHNDEDEIAIFSNKPKGSKGKHLPSYLRYPHFAPTNLQNYLDPTFENQRQPSHYPGRYSRDEEYHFPPTSLSRAQPENQHYNGRIVETAGGGRLSLLNSNVFMSSSERKRIEQKDRIEKAVEGLHFLLEESPSDTKLRGKLLQVQAWARKIDGTRTQMLNRSEVSALYEIHKFIEKRQVANESKAFERMAEAELEAGGYLYGTTYAADDGRGKTAKKTKKRAHEDESSMSFGSHSPASVWTMNTAPTSAYSSPYRTSTVGKPIARGQTPESKRQRVGDGHGGSFHGYDDDAEKGGNDNDNDEQGERKTYGGKTIDLGEGVQVDKYDVQEALLNDQDEEAKPDREGEQIAHDGEENESSDGSSSDTDSEVDTSL